MQYRASFGRINKLHPFAVYHNDDNGELKRDCYCVISDCRSLFYFISNTNNSHKKPQNQQDYFKDGGAL